MSKPILCIDFDGVIHSYSSGWTTDVEIKDPITQGFWDWALAAAKHFRLVIYSSRSKNPAAIEAMRAWFKTQWNEWIGPGDCQELFEFAAEKPAAFLTIDDRAICFEGSWSAPELQPAALLDFKPWNKRPLGATGRYPQGVLTEDDEGELRMAVGRREGLVHIDFGKRVAWLALPPENAIALAKTILKHAGGDGPITLTIG